MFNTENYNQLFSEIAEDLAEAINGGLHHDCHGQTKQSTEDKKWDPDAADPFVDSQPIEFQSVAQLAV